MSNQNPVTIVVDSGVSLPEHFLTGQAQRFHIVPMEVTLSGKTYKDVKEFGSDSFYSLLRHSRDQPTTSAPHPASYLNAFRQATSQSSDIVCLPVASHLSSSHNSARLAIKEFRNESPETKIVLLDTKSAAGSQGLIAIQALKASNCGKTLEEIVRISKNVADNVSMFAYLDTLHYIWKSGRVPSIAYVGASILKIKPVFELSQGKIINLARLRTSKQANKYIIEMIHRKIGETPLCAMVLHADAHDRAREFQQNIESTFKCVDVSLSEFSPVMGAHTGPGLLGVAIWADRQQIPTPSG